MKRYCVLCLITLTVLTGLGPASYPVVSVRDGFYVQGTELSDALLLYDSEHPQTSDWGFRKVVDFYGLTRAEVDLATIPLTDTLLRDEAGAYYPTVFIAGATLESALDATELQVLKTAIEQGGLNLMVGALQIEDSPAVQTLTDGEILGSRVPLDSRKDYFVSDAWPEVTRELSGIRVVHESEQSDYALTIVPDALRTQLLVSSTDDAGQTYPLFARYTKGIGQIFVSGDNPDLFLRYNPLWENLHPISQSNGAFEMQRFAQIVPLLMFVRFTAGDEAWHRDRDYANLTIDDPPLRALYVDYAAILPQAIAHNFHLTVAMPPVFYEDSDPEVVALFRDYPERLSLVQHGNNHDGYEFYKYEAAKSDPYPSRPIEEQEADIVEGRTRMEAHFQRTGIPYAPVMIFPFNISPAPTLIFLKQYNFQATINSQDVPLGEIRSRTSNAHMYPAELSYNNFAVILRYKADAIPYPFELFIDKPLFIYTHGLFNDGPDAFNLYADAINELYGEVEWRSLDEIVKRLYLEKTNDDGSIDVMFFGNDLIVTNESTAQRLYHLKRAETLNVPIVSVTVDGTPVDYTLTDNVLEVGLVIPAGASRELRIRYAPTDRDFALGPSDVVFDPVTRVTTAAVHNRASEAGPVTVGFFEGQPESGGRLLALATAQRIEPGATAVVTATLGTMAPVDVTVAVDPYDVIVETDETNNTAVLVTFRQYLPLISAHRGVPSSALLDLKGTGGKCSHRS